MSNLPLEEIRVLGMTVVFAGPYGSKILGDYGAEVIHDYDVVIWGTLDASQLRVTRKGIMQDFRWQKRRDEQWVIRA